MTDNRVQPGDWGVVSNGPQDSTLRASLASNAIQWATVSRFNHAVICVAEGAVVEAQPGGARRTTWDGYMGNNTVWSGGYGITNPTLQRPALVAAALSLVGTPYGWGDIIAIGLAQQKLEKSRMHVDALVPMGKQPWWVRRLADKRTDICSQLVDACNLLAGIHLYDDGRPSGLVSPGDLGRLLGV